MAEMPSVRNGAQADENERKKPLLNYESPAPTAELQARNAAKLIMRADNQGRKHSGLTPKAGARFAT
jgi:hypothetical protein